MSEALKEKLEGIRLRVEENIESMLPTENVRPARLHQAMRYSMEAGGKRIRPALLILASELDESEGDPMAAAVAIECLHTYTLIHDDLPSIDDSDLRRGRPSCHKQFDEPTALLAGDALLTASFQYLAEHYAYFPELAVELIGDLSYAMAVKNSSEGNRKTSRMKARNSIRPPSLSFMRTRPLLSSPRH